MKVLNLFEEFYMPKLNSKQNNFKTLSTESKLNNKISSEHLGSTFKKLKKLLSNDANDRNNREIFPFFILK